jgi:hypothetical protein
MALRTDLIDRDILRPTEMGVDAFQVLGGESDFHEFGLSLDSHQCSAAA